MRHTFNVPILPHLKKYLVKKFFNGAAGPYKIEENTLLGKQFMSVIIDARKVDFIDKHLEMTENFHITLSWRMAERSPRVGKLIAVNYFIDKLFKEEIISWILTAQYYGVRPYPACKGFLEFYSIDEGEYSLDAVHQLWKRWQNPEYKNKKYRRKRTKKAAVAS